MNFMNGWKLSVSKATWIVVVLLFTTNVLLLRQNLQMRARLGRLQPEIAKAGDKLSPLVARGLHDEAINMRYTGNGPKRVLLYFTPSCPYCRKQFAYWNELVNQLDNNRFEVFGLVSQSEDKAKVKEYLQSMGADSLPLAMASASDISSYKLSKTPLTLLVSNDGTVERAWVGLWDAKSIADASSVLGVALTPQDATLDTASSRARP